MLSRGAVTSVLAQVAARTVGARGASSFAELGVAPHLVARMFNAMKIREPTPVQEEALKLLMPRPRGSAELPPRSVVVRWTTGSGKTLAYALPLFARLDPHAFGVQAIIVTPTRELCLQTLHVLNALGGHGHKNKKGNRIKVMSVMGRPNMHMESEMQHHPPTILVGTPQPLAALLHAQVRATRGHPTLTRCHSNSPSPGCRSGGLPQPGPYPDRTTRTLAPDPDPDPNQGPDRGPDPPPVRGCSACRWPRTQRIDFSCWTRWTP